MPPRSPLSETLFRVLFSLIFIVSGSTHLFAPGAIEARLASAPFAHLATLLAPIPVLVGASGLALLLGGVALLLGYRTRVAAAVLITVLIPITLTVQLGPGAAGPLFKNIALLGGLVFFASNGASAYSLDGRRTALVPQQSAG